MARRTLFSGTICIQRHYAPDEYIPVQVYFKRKEDAQTVLKWAEALRTFPGGEPMLFFLDEEDRCGSEE